MDDAQLSKLEQRTVQTIPEAVDGPSGSITHFIGTVAKTIEPWGYRWQRRDAQLAQFWPEESYLSSAIYSIASARSAFSFEVEGPPKTANRVLDILHSSNFGAGWINLQLKLALSVLTQDNGGFIEVIRDKPRRGQDPWTAPVLGLAVLSPNRCIRTGNPKQPVIYTSEEGQVSSLNWYQVVTFEDFPSVDPTHKGRQYSFVTRVLRAAEIISEITTYKQEKVSGQFARALHLIGGVSKNEIENASKAAKINADNAGLMRYMEPIILASLDPNATVSHVRVDLATLPDAFDEDTALKWYITLLAMAAGSDYQEFSPLPGGNLGTSSQSEILHRKSQAKGHALWMKMLEHKLQNSRVIPKNVSFRFMHQDAIAEFERVKISSERGQDRAARIASNELTPEVAQLMAVDAGDLKPEYLSILNTQNNQETLILTDEDIVKEALSTKNLPLAVKAYAAAWFRRLVESSPHQSLAPISDGLLTTFEEALRNNLTVECRLGTTEHWQNYVLTKAAYEAGIHPHAIRYRLPDDYHLLLRAEGISDNRGSLIYRHTPSSWVSEVKSYDVSGAVCVECGKERTAYSYKVNVGWLPICENHLTGSLTVPASTMKESVGSLENFLNTFNGQALDLLQVKKYNKLRALVTASAAYAFVLGTGRKRHSLNTFELKLIKEALVNTTGIELKPEIMIPTLISLYYTGFKYRFG